jgi:hypothetical protein
MSLSLLTLRLCPDLMDEETNLLDEAGEILQDG